MASPFDYFAWIRNAVKDPRSPFQRRVDEWLKRLDPESPAAIVTPDESEWINDTRFDYDPRPAWVREQDEADLRRLRGE